MSAIPSFTRRTFVGGLLIAVALPACKQSPKSSGELKFFEPNAWLHIGTDNSITFLCDRAEMGQGVYTSLTMLVAEELGVSLDRIKVEFAPPGDAVHQQSHRRADHRRQHQRARRLGKVAQGRRHRAPPAGHRRRR